MAQKNFQSIGGNACIKKHGKIFYSRIAKEYWESAAGIARKKRMKRGKST